MGKFRFLFILMCILAICIPSCTSQVDNQGEELGAKIAEGSRSAIQILEEQRQVKEVAKHIKFETDTFYLDITLEEAKKQGLAEDAYNMWLERLKIYTQEAREVISKGGHYTFVNTYTQSENNISRYDNISRVKNISRHRNVSRYSDYIDTFSVLGTVVYPNDCQCKIAFTDEEASVYKGIHFAFFPRLYNKTDPTAYIISTIEHRVYLEGYKKHPWGAEEKVYAYLNIDEISPCQTSRPIPYPGDLGTNAKPHTLTYTVALACPDKDIRIESYCDFWSVPY